MVENITCVVKRAGPPPHPIWRDAGVAERAALEMRYTRKGIGGSNPSPAENVLVRGREKPVDLRFTLALVEAFGLFLKYTVMIWAHGAKWIMD